MSGTYVSGTEPSPNRNLVIVEGAVSTIAAFPLAFLRKDLSNQERIKYTYEWNTFNQIWSYNYSVSTLNGLSGTLANSPWQFANVNEKLAYINGQMSHISFYSTAALTGVFYDIRF